MSKRNIYMCAHNFDAMSKEEILERLAKSVIEGDVETCKKAANDAIVAGIDAYEAIMQGLAKGMNVVSDLYEKGEYFVPEVICSAEAMYAGMDILKTYLKTEKVKSPGKIVIGVVQGDIHDIGKNLVKLMLTAAGFDVIDLGRDVAPSTFVEKVVETNADICAMSALMTTSMIVMPDIIKELKKRGARAKTMVGGAPLSDSVAEMYGADGYSKDAAGAVRVAMNLVKW
jgi:corrinoid protein of di/trimethylamine methyltransferase